MGREDVGGTSDSPGALAAKLEAARTASEEADIFRRLRRPGMSVRALDSEARRLDMSQRDWWERTHRVEITIADDEISHVLIEKRNALELVRE